MTQIRQQIKEFFTAYYDAETNEICGCKKYNPAWFHEMRHRKQFEIKIIKNFVNYYSIISSILSLVCVFWAFIEPQLFFNFMALIGIMQLPSLILLIFLEIDANIFGYINYKRFKNDSNN